MDFTVTGQVPRRRELDGVVVSSVSVWGIERD